MRLRVRAQFEGATTVEQSPLVVSCPPYILQFEADATGLIGHVSLERSVEDYLPLLPTLAHRDSEHSSLAAAENPYLRDLLAVLQYLESVGAFWCGVRRIRWDRAESDWVPESDVEREQLAVWNLRVTKTYPEEATEIDERYIQVLMQRRPRHEHLTVPLAFYREGRNEFLQFRYVQAFVNFYFMIEGLFGGGGPNYRVKERFKASPTLVSAAGDAAHVVFGQPRHSEALRALARCGLGPPDANTVLDLLVDVRGILHHYSVKSSQTQAHPHNQHEFESVAYLAMAVCMKLIPSVLFAESSVNQRN
jgi:hypothetical protein